MANLRGKVYCFKRRVRRHTALLNDEEIGRARLRSDVWWTGTVVTTSSYD